MSSMRTLRPRSTNRYLLACTLLFAIFVQITQTQITKALPDNIQEGIINSISTSPSITLTPGNTKKLVINLFGQSESITFTFQGNAYRSDVYKLEIKKNNEVLSSDTAYFFSQESLTASLDVTKMMIMVEGNVRFRILTPASEFQYSFRIYQEMKGASDTAPADTQYQDSEPQSSGVSGITAFLILLGIVMGVLGLTALTKASIYFYNKRKIRILAEKKRKLQMAQTKPPKTYDIESPAVSPILILKDPGLTPIPLQKCSITLDEKGLTLDEKGLAEMEDLPQQQLKKENPSSVTSIESGGNNQASTAATIPKLATTSSSLQSVCKDSSESSRGERLQNNSKDPKSKKYEVDTNFKFAKGLALEAITEENSYIKGSATFKAAQEKAKEERRMANKKVSKTKVLPTGKWKVNKIAADPTIDVKSEIKANTNNIPTRPQNKPWDKSKPITFEDIQQLVERVMQEKANEKEMPEISESEDEEEDDFQLPNYFCCMICLKDRRSIVAEPCGHVFSCKKCIKRVMGSARACVLCSKYIKGYHTLKK